jgi:hypothetical protein
MKEAVSSRPNKRCDGLPPDEYWAIDLSKRIDTPVDSRGLIVVDDLIGAVKEYICPEYDWGDTEDRHHLYYYASTYSEVQKQSKGRVPAVEFRELPINIAMLPRRFHNVVHKVVKPASVPKPEVMRGFIDAWTAAGSLYRSLSTAVRAEAKLRELLKSGYVELPPGKSPKMEVANRMATEHFDQIHRRVAALCLTPQEFWPVTPSVQLTSPGKLRKLHGDFGRAGETLERGWQLRKPDVLARNTSGEPCTCLRCQENSSIITSVIN